MRDVVLLYERSCPNVRVARAHLLRAFSQTHVPASWREIDVDAADTPVAWRTLGSPTVLVDGVDVDAGTAAAGAACRLYREGGRFARAPSVECIAAALRAEPARVPIGSASSARRSALLATPGVVLALLPKVFCPACWPAYAAALSAIGLGFLMQERYLLPLTIVFLALATFGMAYGARNRRGYAPAIVGAVAAAALVAMKFAVDSNIGRYVATAAFVAAAIWNAWPSRRATSCGACAPEGPIQRV